MPTFRVTLREPIVSYETKIYQVEVEAEDSDEAHDLAIELVDEDRDDAFVETVHGDYDSDGYTSIDVIPID